MNIGEKIKELREELGMSQDDLARRVGYKSRSSINKIERDGRGLPQGKIKLFARALGVTPAQLMGWESDDHEQEPDIPPTNNPDRDWVYKKLPGMTDEQVKRMRRATRAIKNSISASPTSQH